MLPFRDLPRENLPFPILQHAQCKYFLSQTRNPSPGIQTLVFKYRTQGDKVTTITKEAKGDRCDQTDMIDRRCRHTSISWA
jgi:hypothetical protein